MTSRDADGVHLAGDSHLPNYEGAIKTCKALVATYKVFGDIYTLTPRLLPERDLLTLFHLCEFYDERTARYAELDDTRL